MPETSPGEATQFCGQCGAALRPAAQFCTTCGAPVTAATTGRATTAAASQPKRTSRTMWLAGVAVVGLIVILVLTIILSQPKQQPAVAVAPTPVAAAQQDIPYPDVARVSPGQAHGSFNSGQAVIVDVRDQEFYDQSHAAGAISMPLSEFPARYSELPKDMQIYLYCT